MAGWSIRAFLRAHPRLTSAALTVVLLLSQAGTVLANGNGSSGP